MSNPKVAIFGGTGQTGAAVSSSLEARGATPLRLSRADLVRGAAALEGADAAYLIAPNMHPDEPALVRSYLELMMDARVSRVVYHSVAAPYTPAMRHHLGKAVGEDLVRRSGLDWTILQPCAYIQNFLPAREATQVLVPFGLDVAFGMVDLDDVGEAAAAVLLNPDHVGATYELGGPAMVTIREAAHTAGEILGHLVEPVAETTDAWVRRNRGHLSEAATTMFVDMWAYYDQYGLPTGPRPLAGLLGRRGRSFAEVLARTVSR
jgi:uncharacterized protein YbjT (DUF2867 family)